MAIQINKSDNYLKVFEFTQIIYIIPLIDLRGKSIHYVHLSTCMMDELKQLPLELTQIGANTKWSFKALQNVLIINLKEHEGTFSNNLVYLFDIKPAYNMQHMCFTHLLITHHFRTVY